MIYTIGRRDRYEPAFALMERLNREGRGVPINKSGKGMARDGRPYEGGWVWPSEASARAFIDANGFSDRDVYGVLADWETGTEQREGEPYRRLLRDSEMVRLGPAPDSGAPVSPPSPDAGGQRRPPG
jgi:hypothetical protein